MPVLFRLALGSIIFSILLGACASTPQNKPSPKAALQPPTHPPAPAHFTVAATSLTGQVLNASTHHPLAGVKILTIPATAVTTTDKSGFFILKSTNFHANIEYSLNLTWHHAEMTVLIPPIDLGKKRILDQIFLDTTSKIPLLDAIVIPTSIDASPEYPTLETPD